MSRITEGLAQFVAKVNGWRRCDKCSMEFIGVLGNVLVKTPIGRICAACNVEYLRSMACQPEDRCTEPGCGLSAGEHAATVRKDLARIAMRFLEPSVCRRRGQGLGQ